VSPSVGVSSTVMCDTHLVSIVTGFYISRRDVRPRFLKLPVAMVIVLRRHTRFTITSYPGWNVWLFL